MASRRDLFRILTGIKATSVTVSCLVSESNSPSYIASFNMKVYIVVAVTFLAGLAAAFPQQKEGQMFSNEAIRQAQETYLIPKDAAIQNVQESQELRAYESIPGSQRINLFEILGDQVPLEVVNNLQSQIDQIGKN